jgi:hypothetical protein
LSLNIFVAFVYDNSNFNATMGILSAHARNIRNQEGLGNSEQPDEKMKMGQIRPKACSIPKRIH